MSENTISEGSDNPSEFKLQAEASGAVVSLQVWQDIWYRLTGKVEEISKCWSDPFQVRLNHLQALHKRLEQTCEQYVITGANVSIVVFFSDDRSEQFTSWQKFNTLISSNVVPVESIHLAYNFLVTPPKVQEPQSYSISLRVASRVSVIKKLRSESFIFGRIPLIVRQIGCQTAEAKIKYADYVIARTMLHAIDEWAKSLPCASESKALRWIRQKSHAAPAIFRYFLAAICLVASIEAIPLIFAQDATIPRLAYFLIGAFGCIFTGYKIGHHVGRRVEDAMNIYCSLSYIELTDGDTKVILEAKTINNRSLLISWCGTIATLILSTFSKFCAGWLLHLVVR
ncbi:hypothetical protein ACI2S5_23860 [Ralstonia nicotianae]|uniref:hypothetical protein n=2 Tax=Ralstonia pseudosolanacearum TaxID=1310165 RepID=UPI000AE4075C|nr:hypothetical protein [Ralstonia pseudosolanacearum]NKF89513.1 hypothetical protein [Ralstonia solanacearum]MCK4129042.1 hypothetical protein [Ralstonia pseudosolanacearum]MCK4150049.1 hypothetical protein [Ralstonia pseudosolanacearum]QKL57311.1 hypothetical protein HI814_11875 [Ralstonia solanacearum]QKL71999.1 hypothetical protein HI806_12345 [Ralstonia solanacearum]